MSLIKSRTGWILPAALLVAGLSALRAQAPVNKAAASLGKIRNFKMPLSYFDARSQGQAKSVLMGKEAFPQPDGTYLIKELRLETYRENGEREFLVTAPECVFDQKNRIASSPGKLQAQSIDGRLVIEGEGFLWRQAEARLVISNQVRTVVRKEAIQPTPKKP